MIPVVGSTGSVGSSVARRLAAAGKSVRALVKPRAAQEKRRRLLK